MCAWHLHQKYWPPLPPDRACCDGTVTFQTFVDQHHHDVDVIVVVKIAAVIFSKTVLPVRGGATIKAAARAPSVRQGRPLCLKNIRLVSAQFGGRGATAPDSQKPEFHGGFCRGTVDLLDLKQTKPALLVFGGAKPTLRFPAPVEVPILR